MKIYRTHINKLFHLVWGNIYDAVRTAACKREFFLVNNGDNPLLPAKYRLWRYHDPKQ